MQKFGIRSAQSSQLFGVIRIVLAIALRDQLDLPSIRHNHFMSQSPESSAYPRGVRADLQDHPAGWTILEGLCEACFRCLEAKALNHLAAVVQSTAMAETISQIDTKG
jgi:hypothetical protein